MINFVPWHLPDIQTSDVIHNQVKSTQRELDQAADQAAPRKPKRGSNCCAPFLVSPGAK